MLCYIAKRSFCLRQEHPMYLHGQSLIGKSRRSRRLAVWEYYPPYSLSWRTVYTVSKVIYKGAFMFWKRNRNIPEPVGGILHKWRGVGAYGL